MPTSATFTLDVVAGNLITTVTGNGVNGDSVTIADRIAPETNVATTLGGLVTSVTGLVYLPFSEVLAATNAAFYGNDLEIRKLSNNTVVPLTDYTTSVAANSPNLVITLTGTTLSSANGELFSVKVKASTGYIVDAAGNKSVESSAYETLTKVDVVAPTYAKTASTLYTSVTLTASEALKIGATPVANGADLKAQFTYTGGGSITTAIYNATTKEIVFTIASGGASGDTIKAKATLLDIVGNASATSTIVTAGVTAW